MGKRRKNEWVNERERERERKKRNAIKQIHDFGAIKQRPKLLIIREN